MTNPNPHPEIPTQAEREARNAALLAISAETGFWDDNGHPAPWPGDIDEWTPATSGPEDPSDPSRLARPTAKPRPANSPRTGSIT